ncbi:hypothetical protein LF845_00970 [Deferribacterales bacterium Es71-Z0220]|jgi:hypothetical protein|uniref:hypothetical protein n=1 Tax=Deferrivibrio essentukiensis TaxID=2880922 RepID=UPI001F60F2B0|nr:hypothetical protein [Deferrivibrio essentukiensis]MBZ4642939.1 hypothetical protein [Deferribacteraceae bacterium]MCB4203527.1 hypothetical protein [Deferrivibrio essentukiensis]
MGCPDAIVQHLAGLQGVKNIDFDIKSRMFSMEAEDDFGKEILKRALIDVSLQEKREFTLSRYEEI